ncbi:MAG: TIR domain-containing protein [Blastocatellia bacterium]
MKTFISWSGPVSLQVAKALTDWLRDVFPDVEPWMSEDSIQAGSRWGLELTKELSDTNVGVLCLTPDNLQSLWLHFEAGALSKSLGSSSVIPYRFKLRPTDVGLPLSQFQGVDADQPGTLKLIQSVNKVKERPVEPDRLERAFQKWWPDLQTKLERIDVTTPPAPIRSDRDLLDGLDEQLRRLQSDSSERDRHLGKAVEAILTFAALLLREKHFDLASLADVKQLAPVIVAWSKSVPNAEEFLRALPPENAANLVYRGYNVPRELGEFLKSLNGDLGSTDPRDLGWIQSTVAEAKSLATPYLIKALQLDDGEKRGHAAYLLGLTGDTSAVPHLVPLLSDRTKLPFHNLWPRICDAAALSLERIGTPEAQVALERWRQTSAGSQ